MSLQQQKRQKYVREHKLHEIVDGLLQQLAAKMPEDPFDFLATVLEHKLKPPTAAVVADPPSASPSSSSSSSNKASVLVPQPPPATAARTGGEKAPRPLVAAPPPASDPRDPVRASWARLDPASYSSVGCAALTGAGIPNPAAYDGLVLMKNLQDVITQGPENPMQKQALRQVFADLRKKGVLTHNAAVRLPPALRTAVVDSVGTLSPEETTKWQELEQVLATIAAETKKTDAELVRESWALVSSDLPAVGKLFYSKLFAIAASLQSTVFKGTNMEAQAVRLMDMVHAAVGLLDQPEKLLPVLRTLGERHAGYGVVAEHYPVVATALLQTLSAGLGEHFTADVREAWTRTYGVIQTTMLEGAATPRGKQLADSYAAKAAAPPAKKADAELVRESWALVSGDLPAVGQLFYSKLFAIEASLQTTLFKGRNMEDQADRLTEMLDAAVHLLASQDKLVPPLLTLGERHAGYGVTAEHYPVVAAALLETLSDGLGEHFTPDVRDAWTRTYGVIQTTMLEGAATARGQQLAKDSHTKATPKKSDIKLVRQSWSRVSGKAQGLGGVFYGRLFAAENALHATIFKGTNMQMQSKLIMESLDEAVKLLDQPDNLARFLGTLGERHAGYGTLAEHYPVVAAVLLETLSAVLEDEFTSDISEAWTRIYGFIQRGMVEGANSTRGQALSAQYYSKNPTDMQRSDADLVRESWAVINGDLEALGAQFYGILFRLQPQLEAALFQHVDVEAQARSLMETVDAAVGLLDQPDRLLPVLRTLGERHAGYGVVAEHYPFAGQALLETLSKRLAEHFTADVREAWTRTFGVIQTTMLEGSSTPRAKQLAAAYAASNNANRKPDLELVRESWARVRGDLPRAGRLFYDKLFNENHNLAATLFKSVDMKVQMLRTMDMIDQVVDAMDDEGKLTAMLHASGERHAGYGTQPEQYDAVGSAMLSTLEMLLGDFFDPDTYHAWQRTLKLIAKLMIEGSHTARGVELSQTYALNAALKLAADAADGSRQGASANDGGGLLTHAEQGLVTTTWGMLSGDLVGVGKLLYKVLFQHAPGAEQTLFKGVNMEGQSLSLARMVDGLIKTLGDAVELDRMLVLLGERHVGYGIEAIHYTLFTGVVCAALEIALGDKYSGPVRAAWVKTCEAIASCMTKGSATQRSADIRKSRSERRDSLISSEMTFRDWLSTQESYTDEGVQTLVRVWPKVSEKLVGSRGEDFYGRLEIMFFQHFIDALISIFTRDEPDFKFFQASKQLRFSHCFGCDPSLLRGATFVNVLQQYLRPDAYRDVDKVLSAMHRLCDDALSTVGREGDALVNVLEMGIDSDKHFEAKFDKIISSMTTFDATALSNRMRIFSSFLNTAKHYGDGGSTFMRHCGLLALRITAVGVSKDNIPFIYTELSKLYLSVESKVTNEVAKQALGSTQILFRLVMDSLAVTTAEFDILATGAWLKDHDEAHFGRSIYSTLFALEPTLRETVFRRASVESLQLSFLRMMQTLVAKGDLDHDTLDGLKRLGTRHNIFGIRNEHYSMFITSVAVAVRDMSSHVETISEVTWLKLLDLVVNTMAFKNDKIAAASARTLSKEELREITKVQALQRGRATRKETRKLKLLKSGTLEDIIAGAEDTEVDWESDKVVLSQSDRAVVKLAWAKLGDQQYKTFLDGFDVFEAQPQYKEIFTKVTTADLSKRVCRFFNKLVDQIDHIESLSSIFMDLRCMHQVKLRVTLDMYHDLGKAIIDSLLKHFPAKLHSAIRIPFALFYQCVVELMAAEH